MDLIVMRRDTAELIAGDPWDVTVHHRPVGGNTETSFTLVGKLVPTGAQWGYRISGTGPLVGEPPTARQSWALLTEWDAGVIAVNDRVVVTHRESGVTMALRAVFCTRYSYKREVVLDELG